MKMKTYNIVIIIILLIAYSCESTVQDFEIPEPEPKLVLHAFLGADSIPRVIVTRNFELAQDVSPDYQVNSDVEIFHGDDLLTSLTYNSEFNWFEDPDFHLEGHRDYHIMAGNQGFKDVEAQFYIPEKPDIISIDTQLITIMNTDCIGCEPETHLQFNIKFNNPSGSRDYYSVEVINESMQEIYNYSHDYSELDIDTALIRQWVDISSNAPYIQTIFDGWYYNLQQPETAWGYRFYFSDDLLEDGENEMVFDAGLYSVMYNSVGDSAKFITVKFRKIDEYLFKYVQSKGNNSDSEDNPFVEPVSIYTNVENGLGLVTGYSEYSKTYDISEINMEENYSY